MHFCIGFISLWQREERFEAARVLIVDLGVLFGVVEDTANYIVPVDLGLSGFDWVFDLNPCLVH